MRLTTVLSAITTLISISSASARASHSGVSPAHAQFLRLRTRATCPDGQYKPNRNSSQCRDCPAGSSCEDDVATACPRGEYQPSTGQSSCLKCPPGTWNDQTGVTSCKLAQAGWYAQGPGATRQTECGKGKYSSPGSSSCTACPAGHYCNSYTNATPTKCPPGRYNPYTGKDGEDDCIRCPKGTFQSEYGSTSCCECCSGYYNDQIGQNHCFECPNIPGQGQNKRGTSDPGATAANQCRSSIGGIPARSNTCTITSNTCPPTTPPPTSSNLPRRAEKREQLAIRQCEARGPGFKHCPMLNGGHDCVDTLNDFESCGGCVNFSNQGGRRNGTGQDCGALPNVGSVSCQSGKCVIENCSKGYQLSEDKSSCVESLARRSYL